MEDKNATSLLRTRSMGANVIICSLKLLLISLCAGVWWLLPIGTRYNVGYNSNIHVICHIEWKTIDDI